MAIRYIDTSFYKSPFVRSLKGSLKGLYSFIICDCTGAGIWTKDLGIAAEYIGFKVTESDFEIFVKSGKAIDLKNGKYFFPDFIEHQYPKGLSEKNPAQKNFVLELKKYGLLDEKLKVLQRPFEGSQVIVTVIEEVIVTEKVKVKEEVSIKKEIPTIDEFLAHCKLKLQEKYIPLEFSLKAKYDSWVAASWKDGNGNPIQNWKTKIMNVVPYMKADASHKPTQLEKVVSSHNNTGDYLATKHGWKEQNQQN